MLHPMMSARRWRRRIVARSERVQVAMLRRIYNPRRESRPAFLVGCGRSGTTMLVRQLARSWQVELYNEDHPAAFDNFRLRELQVIEELIERSNAPLVLFKPILSTTQSRALLERFPEARIVFAFRHFGDVVSSSLKKFGRENRIGHVRRWMEDDFAEFAVAPPPEQTKTLIRSLWQPFLTPESGAALYWLFYNQLYYDLDLDKDSRVLLVRYESMVAEPRKQFAALAHFLGLHFEERFAEGVFSSSVRQQTPATIDNRISAVCRNLYERLSAHSLNPA